MIRPLLVEHLDRFVAPPEALAHESVVLARMNLPDDHSICRPLVRQTSRITAIDGDTVTLADPLLHDVNENIPAQVATWDGLEEVGIEDLHLEFPNAQWFGHHMEQGYNGIYFTSAFDSWARNIRITNADSRHPELQQCEPDLPANHHRTVSAERTTACTWATYTMFSPRTSSY